MDSSDSEDDCYGNIAQKLQRMKNKYAEDKIESTNLLNESTDLEEIVKTGKNESTPAQKISSKPIDEEDADSIMLETLLSTNTVTRSSNKRSSRYPTRSSKRKKISQTPTNESVADNTDNTNIAGSSTLEEIVQNTNQRTNRPRGQSNRGRRRRTAVNNSNIPTYSVGNTEEYPDQSETQQLFSCSKNLSEDIIIVEENDYVDENEELSVKVYWQSSDFFKFKIRRFQKLSQIFDFFSKKENVSHDQLFFTFNEKILKCDDTPDSINYSIAKFIDGGIVKQSVSQLLKSNKKEMKNGIKIKFQCQNVKKPFETAVRLDDKLSLAMIKCAEHFEISFDKLKFEFDGDAISGKITARDLELEGGECIDVKITSS